MRSHKTTNGQNITRRGFVRAAGCGVAAAGMVAGQGTHVMAAGSKPAILGGTPLINGSWPAWPITDDTEKQSLLEVLRSGSWYRYNRGKTVTAFEEAWSENTGTRFCQATNSGTSSLITALAALNIGPGDEVLVPPYTFIATVNAALIHHALPVFVDTDPETAQIDPSKVAERVTPDTRCVVPVHLAGGSCDMDQLMEVAREKALLVLEDSCQSHTGQWKGKRLGSLGDAGCFSFQNSKNLTSGEGGAVITNNEAIYRRARTFHNNGNGGDPSHGQFTANGGNFRLTEFQGALLLDQLQRLEEQSVRREANADRLDAAWEGIEGVRAKRKPAGLNRHGYHLYMFDFDSDKFAGMSKSQFIKALNAEGVPASGGYRATNEMDWVAQMLESRGFQRIYGKKRLARWRDENRLPGNEQTIATTCWLGQYVLLADPQQVERIPAAIRRIQQHADAIAKS